MSNDQRRFVIDNQVFELFPTLTIAVMVFRGIDNQEAGQPAPLEAACERLSDILKKTEALPPQIQEYSQAMKRIKRKKGCLSSIEAMAKRIKSGEMIKSINPVVDLYNAVSLQCLITCGGEDLDKVAGDMVLGLARGDESFVPLGGQEDSPPREGELIYRDDIGAVVRSWLWREADRTKIDHQTRNIMLYMELINDERHDDLSRAMQMIQHSIQQELGGTVETHLLSKNQPTCEI